MPKKVAVQKGLEDIRRQLTSLGYDVSEIEDEEDVEAIIYMADGYSIPYESQTLSMNVGDNMTQGRGTILINATGKNIDEIEYVINNRIYSPLFDR